MYQNFNKVYLINKFSRLQITSHVFNYFIFIAKKRLQINLLPLLEWLRYFPCGGSSSLRDQGGHHRMAT